MNEVLHIAPDGAFSTVRTVDLDIFVVCVLLAFFAGCAVVTHVRRLP